MVETRETSRQITFALSEDAQWWLVSTINRMLEAMNEPARFELTGDFKELTLKIGEESQ